MIKKEALLEELAKEDLQVLVLAYVYAKNVEMLNKAYHKGYYDATNKKISDGGPD